MHTSGKVQDGRVFYDARNVGSSCGSELDILICVASPSPLQVPPDRESLLLDPDYDCRVHHAVGRSV